MQNKGLFKRLGAYLIDILVISCVAYVISFIPMNPNKEIYDNYYEQLNEISQEYKDEKIDQEEYIEKAQPISYKISKYGIVYSIVNISISLVYFVFIQYKCNGQTLGKKIMKIKVVSNDNKLSLGALALRGVIMYGLLTNALDAFWLSIFTEASYTNASYILNLIQILLFYTSVAMAIVREDNRGLHDILANTKVVLEQPETDDKIIEANFKEKE